MGSLLRRCSGGSLAAQEEMVFVGFGALQGMSRNLCSNSSIREMAVEVYSEHLFPKYDIAGQCRVLSGLVGGIMFSRLCRLQLNGKLLRTFSLTVILARALQFLTFGVVGSYRLFPVRQRCRT